MRRTLACKGAEVDSAFMSVNAYDIILIEATALPLSGEYELIGKWVAQRL